MMCKASTADGYGMERMVCVHQAFLHGDQAV